MYTTTRVLYTTRMRQCARVNDVRVRGAMRCGNDASLLAGWRDPKGQAWLDAVCVLCSLAFDVVVVTYGVNICICAAFVR